jgi:hypothetical protein
MEVIVPKRKIDEYVQSSEHVSKKPKSEPFDLFKLLSADDGDSKMEGKDSNLLFVKHSELFKRLHPTKNKVNLDALTCGVAKELWWVCDKGHEELFSVKHMIKRERSCTICYKEANLLKTEFPEIFKEIHHTKNGNIELSDITKGSNRVLWWVCATGHSYQCSVYNRVIGLGCSTCVHIKKASLAEFRNRERGDSILNSLKVGELTEEFVKDLLEKQTVSIEKVEKIGEYNGPVDLVVYFKDTTIKPKQLQVKTLTPMLRKKDSYNANRVANYDPNLLIVMVNKERTRFALDFAKNFTGSVTLYFNSSKTKYHHIQYTSIDKFCTDLVEMTKLSTDFTDIQSILSEDTLKELYMFTRLKDQCNQIGLTCERNTINSTTVDAFINSVPVQLKFSSRMKNSKGCINCNKSAGSQNGKMVSKPYSIEDEFEFFIVELYDKTPEKLFNKDDFYIFPKSKLVDENIVSNGLKTGKQTFTIPSIKHNKTHWSSQYLNNFSLLQS